MRVRTAAVALLSLACLRCGGAPVGPTELRDPAVPPVAVSPPPAPPPSPPVAPSAPVVFVGAGDIADCAVVGSAATAALLDTIGGTIFTLGDNAYFSGTREAYRNCYEPRWGRHKSRTRPAPGNHDYDQPGATPYFEYFGASAGPPGRGYYSFDHGAWHAISLNSSVQVGPGSAQESWLREDLAASRAKCTIAYWHHSRFSSGQHGDQAPMRHFWQVLYDAGADVVLSAHDHLYERFAPQDPDGRADPARGIRQFTAGTGGAPLYQFTTVRPNSEVRISTWGVLKLTLFEDSYEWEFIPVSGARDSGTGQCH